MAVKLESLIKFFTSKDCKAFKSDHLEIQTSPYGKRQFLGFFSNPVTAHTFEQINEVAE